MDLGKEERRDAVKDAGELIAEAIENLKLAVSGTPREDYFRRTLIASLEHMVGAGAWLDGSVTLFDLDQALAGDLDA